MKRQIAEFVSNYGICQQVKIEHSKPAGELQSLSISEWKWEDISMDFMTGLPRGKKGNSCHMGGRGSTNKICFVFANEDD